MPKQPLSLVISEPAAESDPAGPGDTRVSPSALVVRDTESGEVVAVTDAMRARVAAARRLIEQATLAKAIALRTVADERLYLADGYGSFKDWVRLELGSSYQSAKDYVRIGRRMAPLFPALTEGDGLAGDAPQLTEGHPGVLDSERSGAISGLGFGKLRELVRLDDARFSDVVERGVVTLDGEEFTLDELQEMSKREVAARVRDELAPVKDRLAEQAAEIETLKAEKDALLEERERDQKTVEDARALEYELGSRASLLADKRRRLTELRETVDRLLPAVLNTGIGPDDPETVQHDLVALMDKLELCAERARATYAPVQARLAGLD